jgi:predicted MFS family arabinose efflux permease
MQGMGDSFVATAGTTTFFNFSIAYSVVTIEFPSDKEQFMGYCESAIGIGLMTGPVLGSLIYSGLKYQGTFFCFAILLSICCLLIVILLPSRVNNQLKDISHIDST